jgi:outer membrane protein insertion porin family
LLLVGALLVAGSVAAQQSFLRGRIQEIEVQGARSLPDETVLFYLGLETGADLDADELNSNIHKLWERDLIEDIEIQTEQVSGGIKVIVHLRERPLLTAIEYEGLKRVNRSDVLERFARDRINVREGGPVSQGELYRLKAAIEDLYAEKGYRLAEAQYSMQPSGPGEVRVVFDVDEGDKIKIGDIDFEGNTIYRDLRLRWVMKKTKESSLGTKFGKKDIYNPANLEEDLELVKEIYRNAGYKNVMLGEPAIEVIAANPDAPTEEKQKRRLRITIPIEEGQRWLLGEVSVEGSERFNAEVLKNLFPKQKGGWLRASTIDKGLESLNELYSNSGYLFTAIETEIIEREENIADLVIHIDEGDQFRVGRIDFEGNTRTRDKVLRREMRVQEGLVFNAGALRNSLRRIGQLEYFRIDEENPVEFDFDNENTTVDLHSKGEEGDRTELQMGGGWSEIDGFFGQFSMRSRNFRGRGETLGVSVQVGRYRNVFDVSYFMPWFLDRPQSAGLQIFRRDQNYTLTAGQDFEQNSTGAVLTYGRNFGIWNSLSFAYSFSDVEDRRSIRITEDEFFEQDFSRTISSLRASLVRNTIDSRVNPTNGRRWLASIELAGSFLGGDTDFIRPRAGISDYYLVTRRGLKTVFHYNIDVGYIQPISDAELFFFDRFYLGGENSIRGHRYRSIWVRDSEGNTVTDEFGSPLGGTTSVQANIEYHVLVGGPFRILGFFDTGNVYSEDQPIDLNRMRYTAGVEMRLFIPMFGQPLRFIFSENLDPLPDDRFESFQFSIGAGF